VTTDNNSGNNKLQITIVATDNNSGNNNNNNNNKIYHPNHVSLNIVPRRINMLLQEDRSGQVNQLSLLKVYTTHTFTYKEVSIPEPAHC
jgi:hypothetical protein